MTVRNYYWSSTTPQIPANTFAMIQLLSVVGVSVLRRSRFHLLWLFPVSYNASFFTPSFKNLGFSSVAVRIRSGLHNSVKLVCL